MEDDKSKRDEGMKVWVYFIKIFDQEQMGLETKRPVDEYTCIHLHISETLSNPS